MWTTHHTLFSKWDFFPVQKNGWSFGRLSFPPGANTPEFWTPTRPWWNQISTWWRDATWEQVESAGFFFGLGKGGGGGGWMFLFCLGKGGVVEWMWWNFLPGIFLTVGGLSKTIKTRRIIRIFRIVKICRILVNLAKFWLPLFFDAHTFFIIWYVCVHSKGLRNHPLMSLRPCRLMARFYIM